MKNTRDFFKNKEYLLDEPEVVDLLASCEAMQDEIIDLKFEKQNNKQLVLIDIIKEIVKGCVAIEKEKMEHERFGFPPPNYPESIKNLHQYITVRCREEKIWL